MTFAEIKITQCRNLNSVNFACHPRFTLIEGLNGSGKTSLLEALNLLASGRSFRAHEVGALISYGCTDLTIFARTHDDQKIGIQKSLLEPTTAQINGKTCQTASQLAVLTPCQLFYQDLFQLIDAGPALRRDLLNWGVFHVEHRYHKLWKDYRRSLKQRNRLLKQNVDRSQLKPWNLIITELAEKLDGYRKPYCEQLNQLFSNYLKQLTDFDCELHYYKGWDRKNEKKTLTEVLEASYSYDLQRQTTTYGAHHADLLITYKPFKVKYHFSRGQQKIILFALKFAQAKIMAKPCIFLIDDLSAELDSHYIKQLCDFMKQNQGQFFITQRSNESLDNYFSPDEYTKINLVKGALLA